MTNFVNDSFVVYYTGMIINPSLHLLTINL